MKGCLCTLLLCISLQSLFGQQNTTVFKETELTEVIRNFEQHSEYVFNYDPSLLTGYVFTGSIDINNPQHYISKVLYETPFDFESKSQTILIYMPEPQLYRICGTIQDDLNAEGLIGANVYADNTNSGSQSDKNGFFDFEINASKNQRITMSYIGYNTISMMVQELNDNCPTYNLSIDKNAWNEVVVKDSKLNGISEAKIFSGYELNFNQLSNHYSSPENDVLKSVQLLPGITSLDESASNFQIRGSAKDQNLIMWEGATIYNSGHLFGMVSAINPFSLDKVDVYKGAYDPKYDNRVGGIIDISLVDTISSSFHGSAGFTLTEAHTNVEVPVIQNKMSLVLSGRHSLHTFFDSPPLQSYTSKVSQFSKIDDNLINGLPNTEQEINYYDFNAKVLIKPSEKLFFTSSFYKNSQRFSYDVAIPDIPFTSSDSTLVNTTAFSTKLEWKPTTFWNSTISMQHSTYDNLFDYVAGENDVIEVDYEQFNSIQDQSIRITQNVQASSHISLEGGYEYNRKSVNLDIIDFRINEEFIDNRSSTVGHFHNIFSSFNYDNNQWSIHGGIRSTYYSEQKKWFSSPRLSVQYAVHNNLTLKMESGIFHQFISQLQDFGINVIDETNPFWTLNAAEFQGSQKANKISSGFVFRKKGWLLDLEAYYYNTSGLFTQSNLFDPLIEDYYSIGSSKAIGLDFLINKRWNNFNLWANYSLAKTRYLFPDISETSFLAPNDIRHNISVVSSYNISNFQFTINALYRSGVPVTNPNGLKELYKTEEGEAVYFFDYDEFNADRLPTYFRTDISLSYRPTLKKYNNIKAEFSFSLINIFNRENIFVREYRLDPIPNQAPMINSIDRVLLGRTPLLKMRVYW